MNNELGTVLLTDKQIVQLVTRLATQLNKDYKKQTPVLVGVLNGAFVFMADLVRQLTFAPEICFVQVSSYCGSTKSKGEVTFLKDIEVNLQNRSVLIVEDIVDSGLTIRRLVDYVYVRGAHFVRVCTLLSRSKSTLVDYVGCQLETSKFLVGYGLDLDNQFRNLPYIMEIGD